MAHKFAKIMDGRTPSKYQLDIFETIEDRLNGTTAVNLIVEAVAGSGKTSTIVAAAKLIPSHVSAAFFAFGKKIAATLGEKLPRHVPAMTLNSLGMRIWGSYIRGRGKGNVTVDMNKVSKLVRNLLTKGENQEYGAHVIALVKLAKAFGVVPQGYVGAVNANGLSDTMEFWADLAVTYNRDIESRILGNVVSLVRKVLTASLNDETTIDFDDQLYMPVVKRTEFGTPIPHSYRFDVVMVDEAQDLNPVQRSLLRLAMKPNSFMIAVGDPRQAIYGFRGAAVDSLDKIAEEFNCIRLPLSISYRCAKAIVAHAQEIVSHIEASPSAIDGAVTYIGDYKPTLFQPSDMIVCRNNAPLISFAYKLIKARVRAKVMGRDIGKDLISLINRIDHQDSVSLLVEKLTEWRDQQIAIVKAKDEDDEAGIQRVNDRYDSIMIFAGDTVQKTVTAMISDIEAMFAEVEDVAGGGFVILATGHKSKGLEARRVFFLDAHLMYGRWIKQGSWQYAQEVNLDYVIRTRGMEELTYIQSDKLAA
jgi:DNA helicase-2/ATP-dependent DNA helicase PcrA